MCEPTDETPGPSLSLRALCVFCIACLPAAAQVVWLTAGGESGGDRFGASIDRLDDLNGDGVDELLVGAPDAGEPFGASGSVSILDGVTGAVLFVMGGDAAGDRLGASVARIDDIDDDGLDDFVAGAPFAHNGDLLFAGEARLVSSADGSVIATFRGERQSARLGNAVERAGDVDADGVGDLILDPVLAALPFPEEGPWLVSGALQTVWLVSSFKSIDAVTGIGDVNGDGHDDLAFGNGFWVRIVSGANGDQMLLVQEDVLGVSELGEALEPAGDLDGDGCPDLYAGGEVDFVADDGVVVAIDACDGSALFVVEGTGDEELGAALATIGDVNGDGLRDLAAGAPFADGPGGVDAGRVVVLDGRDGEVLAVLDGTSPAERFGAALADPGDVDGDGTGDLVVSSPLGELDDAQSSAGVVRTFVDVTPWSGLGAALAGSSGTPRLRAIGTLLVDEPVTLRLDEAPAHATVRLVVGFSTIDLPFQGGTLVPSPDLVLGPLVTDADGRLDVSAPWGAGVPPGTDFVVQAWIDDGGGFAASNAVQGVVP